MSDPNTVIDTAERANEILGLLLRRLDVRMLALAAEIATGLIESGAPGMAVDGSNTAAVRLKNLAKDLRYAADTHAAYSTARGANPAPCHGAVNEEVNETFGPFKINKRLH